MRLTRELLNRLCAERILVLDGAMGTMIQSYGLGEADFRGELLADHPRDLKGNNDLLCLTRPEVIAEIHHGYLAAGADIVTTNTFNGTSISQADYGTSHLVREINLAAARLARAAADEFTAADPDRPRFVAGSLAPTNRTCSISPDVNDPGLRNITYRDLVTAYTEEAEALLDGGVDLLMIETVFDPLNAKAAVFAVRELLARRNLERFPVWISGTITDASGRMLTGQTPEAFWVSLRHADPAVFGLNCALGAEAMRPFVAEIAECADTLVSAHPNAGLPNELGGYDETPGQMAARLGEFAEAGLINVAGGCCGTTPAFIAAIAEAVRGVAPRRVPPKRSGTFLAGLEPLRIDEDSLFVNVGERTNVAGSRRFARLVREGDWERALEVGRQQVRGGAQVIDVNMDDALLDAPAAMATFLNFVAGDPEIARVPVMIDSSDWKVLEAGLERVQGKGIVNSLSLKDGEEEFRRRARLVMRYGAAAVVMAFDERGQADTLERRMEILLRAWRILGEEGFPAEDVVFDPNVYAVGTGLPEHDRYALDYIETCRRLKQECPGALISGGISNLSFSFRGNDAVREAMHSVFLYHAIEAGLDMGIVNAGQLAVYQEIEPKLLEAVQDVVLARRPDATERLTELAQGLAGRSRADREDLSWRRKPVAERLAHALLAGESRFVDEDALAALEELGSALKVIEGPLMDGMNQVGDLFGAGKMFLPQVIRSARVMKRAVGVLEPHLQQDAARQTRSAGRIVMATVKGDVHDIGKNIVGVVLGCNGYEVIDLGVMVPAEKIIAAALEHEADAIGLSGLITPSLHEMVHVAQEMTRAGLKVPLLIGGATTSRLHTALKIAPVYSMGVFHVQDASRAAGRLGGLLQPGGQERETAAAEQEYERLREQRADSLKQRPLLDWGAARANAPQLDWANYEPPRPNRPGRQLLTGLDLRELRGYIDWTPFLHTWKLPGRYPEILDDPQAGPEAKRLLDAAAAMLDELIDGGKLEARAAIALLPAVREGDDLLVETEGGETLRVPFLRQQRRSAGGRPNVSLADYVAPAGAGRQDWIGAFVVTAGLGAAEAAAERERAGDDFDSILIRALADRLAEAGAEWLHRQVRLKEWGYAADEKLDNEALIGEQYRGIRPAPGYPACPDHAAKRTIFDLTAAEEGCGVSLTESWAMEPAATVAGWYFSHPEARYFGLGRIGRDQLADYAARCGIDEEEAARRLAPHLD